MTIMSGISLSLPRWTEHEDAVLVTLLLKRKDRMNFDKSSASMNKLENEINHVLKTELSKPDGPLLQATPLPPLPKPTKDIPRYGVSQFTTMQVIAHAITKLTWKEAESLGAGIQAKVKDGVPLAAAIQAWAEDWEKFE
jgi:hypothetical protein